MNLVNIGYGNMVSAQRILAIVSPESAPIRRMIQDGRDEHKVIDATCGRRTRAVVLLDTGHMILSPLQTETLSQRTEDKTQKTAEAD